MTSASAKSSLLKPEVSAAGAHQHICTECGKPFISRSSLAHTCCDAHRIARGRRRKREGAEFSHWRIDPGTVLDTMAAASEAAVKDIPNIARQVIADELRPRVREHMSGKVLDTIGSLLDLMPLMHQALADDLTATSLVYNTKGDVQYDETGAPLQVPDYERRSRAVALMMKATVLHPGLAPQPEQPKNAPITIEFTGYGALHEVTDAEVVLPALPPGSRECDICHEIKDSSDFVADSDRCQPCHEAQRARVEEALAARTAAGAR